jgi:exportin-2 (importin alpha re-exporter)
MFFGQISQLVDAVANDSNHLVKRMESLRLIVSIYYSLVFQDLPEYFEDYMTEWMQGFAKYLQYKNPLLVDEDNEDEPGPIDKLQTAVIDVLKLFVERDEEPFQPFLNQFTELVWSLLVSLTPHTKHDQLVVISLKYLSILVGRKFYSNLFETDGVLQQIVSNIVIPNLMVRESDQENFEDNPQEYIMTELEGSDNESRRRCSRELLRAMCRQFEPQTTAICSDHVTNMIAEYATNPQNNWVQKDTAVSTNNIICAFLQTRTFESMQLHLNDLLVFLL